LAGGFVQGTNTTQHAHLHGADHVHSQGHVHGHDHVHNESHSHTHGVHNQQFPVGHPQYVEGSVIVEKIYEKPVVISHQEKTVYKESYEGQTIERHDLATDVRVEVAQPIVKEIHQDVIHEHHKDVVVEHRKDILHEHH
jgi:hypothetical protein